MAPEEGGSAREERGEAEWNARKRSTSDAAEVLPSKLIQKFFSRRPLGLFPSIDNYRSNYKREETLDATVGEATVATGR